MTSIPYWGIIALPLTMVVIAARSICHSLNDGRWHGGVF